MTKFSSGSCLFPDTCLSSGMLAFTHRVGGNRKRFEQSPTVGQTSLETVFTLAICHQSGDKWQSKTLFLTVIYLRSSTVLTFSIATYQV